MGEVISVDGATDYKAREPTSLFEKE